MADEPAERKPFNGSGEGGEGILTPEVHEDPALEARAKRMGWAPKDQWRGDPEKWVTAAEFIAKADRDVPVLRERLGTMDKRLERTESQLVEANKKLGEATDVMVQLRDWARKADERAYARARGELKERQRQAVQESNVEAFDDTMRQMDALDQGFKEAKAPLEEKKPPPPPPPPPAAEQVATDPVIQAWVAENSSWFYASKEINDFAASQFGMLVQTQPGWTTQERLAEVKRRTQGVYPEKFTNPRRSDPAAVSEPAPSGGGKSKKVYGYADLPADAKKQCDKFVKTIPGYTQEEYVKEYVRNYGEESAA